MIYNFKIDNMITAKILYILFIALTLIFSFNSFIFELPKTFEYNVSDSIAIMQPAIIASIDDMLKLEDYLNVENISVIYEDNANNIIYMSNPNIEEFNLDAEYKYLYNNNIAYSIIELNSGNYLYVKTIENLYIKHIIYKLENMRQLNILVLSFIVYDFVLIGIVSFIYYFFKKNFDVTKEFKEFYDNLLTTFLDTIIVLDENKNIIFKNKYVSQADINEKLNRFEPESFTTDIETKIVLNDIKSDILILYSIRVKNKLYFVLVIQNRTEVAGLVADLKALINNMKVLNSHELK